MEVWPQSPAFMIFPIEAPWLTTQVAAAFLVDPPEALMLARIKVSLSQLAIVPLEGLPLLGPSFWLQRACHFGPLCLWLWLCILLYASLGIGSHPLPISVLWLDQMGGLTQHFSPKHWLEGNEVFKYLYSPWSDPQEVQTWWPLDCG